jgi:phosphonate transport system permease protein
VNINQKTTTAGRIKPDQENIRKIQDITLWTAVICIVILSFSVTKVDPVNLFSGLSYSASLLGEMYPPDFSGWNVVLSLTMETIAMGVMGTLMGLLIAFPLSFLAARNTTTGPVAYYITRSIVSFFRTMPDMVYALIFIVSFGMGPVPGVLSLALGTVGMLTKFYSEALESIDIKPVEALNATGSHRVGVIRHAVIPQVVPVFTSYTMYMLDSNIRTAVTIGIVGAGGLGVLIYMHMQQFHFQKVAAMLILIILVVSLINRTSAYLRKGIIDGTILQGSRRALDAAVFAAFTLIALVSVFMMVTQIDYPKLAHGLPIFTEMAGMFLPPDFTNLNTYLSLVLETIAIGISGTAIAILIAIPLSLMMAQNIVKNPIASNVIRELANLLRAMPEMILAILFVAAVGLGPFAGVLAIALHTSGILGEFYAGAIENIDPKPVEAIEGTGARFIQRVRHAIFPQIFPIFNSNNLYILDRNIRASVILGMVGAGGIGFVLLESFRILEYRQAMAIMIVMLITIFAIDTLSAYIRKKVV